MKPNKKVVQERLEQGKKLRRATHARFRKVRKITQKHMRSVVQASSEGGA